MTSLPPIISPTKKALRFFLEKKEEELKQLNERLDIYIQRVKTLEDSNGQLTDENEKLKAEITVCKRSKETEITQYESRLEEANRLYEEVLRERARLHNENRKNASLADEYKKELDKEIKAHKVTEDALKTAQWQLSEKERQLVARNQDIKELEAKLLQRIKECQELRDALESAKYNLEQETLSKIDLESKLLAKKRELDSMKKKFEKDIAEIHNQLEISEAKCSEVESEMKTRYEEMLAQQLQELRNELETRFNSKYEELQQKYLLAVKELTTIREEKRTWAINVENLRSDLNHWQSKCNELQQMYNNNWEELSNVLEENRNLTIAIEKLKSQKGQRESENASLVRKIEDLEKLRKADERRFEEIIAQKDAFIEECNDWIQKHHEYDEDLMPEVKKALDSDIKDYRRMLDAAGRRKRKRLEFERKACIQIEEANIDGKFVKLFNGGTKDIPLGGWSVERSVDGEPPVIYKFTRKYVLKSGSYVTIWASRGGGQHKPPTDLVFKKTESWGVGKETKTVLKDSDGQEAASEAPDEVDGGPFGKTEGDGRPHSPKRPRRVEENEANEHSSEGFVHIEKADIEGKFVKLFNSGSKDIPLGGWSVERSVDGEAPVIFRFTRQYVLKSGSYVTIWASKGGGQHKPPTDLVFTEKESWGVGKKTKTVLRDSDGQEAASELHEVKIIRTVESDTQETNTLIREDARVIRTLETSRQALTIKTHAEHQSRGNCIIQ